MEGIETADMYDEASWLHQGAVNRFVTSYLLCNLQSSDVKTVNVTYV